MLIFIESLSTIFLQPSYWPLYEEELYYVSVAYT